MGGDEESESGQQEAGRGGVEARQERGGETQKARERRRDFSDLYRICSSGGGATPNRNVIT